MGGVGIWAEKGLQLRHGFADMQQRLDRGAGSIPSLSTPEPGEASRTLWRLKQD